MKMKRNILIYILLSVLTAGFAAVAVYGFVANQLYTGGFAIAMAGICIIAILAFAMQETFTLTCDMLFREKKFEEERALIEKKMRSPFYFIMRIPAMMHYVCVTMALDDLKMSARYIDRLRHGGGRGWKYMTAYCHILIKLDEGNIAAAKTEFEEFRRDCAHAVIYQEQIEVLTAIFTRLLTARNAVPLPVAAVNSSYPVVSRILGRHYEEQIANRTEWN